MPTPEELTALQALRPQTNALYFFLKLINDSLEHQDVRATVNAFLQFGEYLSQKFPNATLEDIQKELEIFSKADAISKLSIPNSLIMHAIISARNEMIRTPPENLSEEEGLRWDVEEMPSPWKRQLADLHLGCFGYLPLLESRGDQQEATRMRHSPDYSRIKMEVVNILNEQAHCAEKNFQGLLDVDETAALSGQARGLAQGGNEWNAPLFDTLYENGIRDIWLLSNYTVKAAEHVDRVNNPDPTPSRYLLVQELLSRGFRVHGVLTHPDLDYGKEPGAYYLEHISEFEIKIAESETLPEETRYQPREDVYFIEDVQQENIWKEQSSNADRAAKAEEFQRLLLSLSESLPTEAFDHVLKRGFVFIDDRENYLTEMEQAVCVGGLPSTALITVLCETLPGFGTLEHHKAQCLYFQNQFSQLELTTKNAHQELLNKVAAKNKPGFFSRSATKMAHIIDSGISMGLNQKHGASLFMLAEALLNGNGIHKNVDSAIKLYELAIVYIEKNQLRKVALKALEKAILERILNPEAVYDPDERIHVHKQFDEACLKASVQKDAIFQHRLAQAYDVVAQTYSSYLENSNEAKTYKNRALSLYQQAHDFASVYQKTSGYEDISQDCLEHLRLMEAEASVSASTSGMSS